MCKHEVATLLKYLYEKEQIIKEKELIKTNNLIKEITKNMSRTPKSKVYLDVDIKYQHDATNYSSKSFVELKVGEDKLYVAKIFKLKEKKKEIIESVINDETGVELFLSQMSLNEIEDLFI